MSKKWYGRDIREKEKEEGEQGERGSGESDSIFGLWVPDSILVSVPPAIFSVR